MAVNVSLNGVTYSVAQPGDSSYASNFTNYFIAIASGTIQKNGGTQSLTADLDFGASFGLKSLYYKTRTANLATAGQYRLAHADTIVFRNNANDGNLTLGVDSSNALTFNGSSITTPALTSAHLFVGNASNVATDVALSGDVSITNAGVSAVVSLSAGLVTNTMVNASAAIAYSKLNLTGAIVNADINASAAVAVSKLASLGGSTNAVVTQDAGGHIQASAILSTDLFKKDGSVTATGDFNMGSHKLTSVTNPASAQDAATKAYVDALVGGGGIFQVVTGATGSTSSTTSATMQSTNLTASITPSSASHHVLVLMCGSIKAPSDAAGQAGITIFRDATNLAGAGNTPFIYSARTDGNTDSCIFPVSIVYYDAPSSTSALTYTAKVNNTNGKTTTFPGSAGQNAQLILIEI